MAEGDAESADAVTVEHVEVQTRRGHAVQAVYVPLLPEQPEQKNAEFVQSMPGDEPGPNQDLHDFENVDDGALPKPNKVTGFTTLAVFGLSEYFPQDQQYLRDFADRVDDLLQAILDREALPSSATCRLCNDRSRSLWRCRECTLPDVLCRRCMRLAHMSNPFHRIECWTGAYFRKAELHEVGVYVMIGHRDGEVCATLEMQKKLREGIQKRQDEEIPGVLRKDCADLYPEVDDELYEAGEVDGDDEFAEYMDRLWNRDRTAADRVKPSQCGESTNEDAEGTLNSKSDMLRVVHTNGVHRMPVITCACRGPEDVFLDLAYSRFLPTSFTRVKTLFTTAVLDDYRITNLECKASAYQYWQRLRRMTNSLAPESVDNRYKELLRMSQLWRWMKKLKWSGMRQVERRDALGPLDGQLAIFCPACPQVGINIPENWKLDRNR